MSSCERSLSVLFLCTRILISELSVFAYLYIAHKGSILGAMLFVIFINDAPEVINNELTLTNLDVWSRDNNIKFNGSKCKVMSVTRKEAPVSFLYHLGSKELLRVDDEKDLGIILSSYAHQANGIESKQAVRCAEEDLLFTNRHQHQTYVISFAGEVEAQLCVTDLVANPRQSTQ